MPTPQQLSLGDVPQSPMTRRTDPATSKYAAKTVDCNSRQRECLQALAAIGGVGTAEDVAAELAQIGFTRDRNCVSKRLGELVKRGLVRRGGVSTSVTTGRPQTMWVIER